MRSPDPTLLDIPDFSLVVLIGATGSGKSMFAARWFGGTAGRWAAWVSISALYPMVAARAAVTDATFTTALFAGILWLALSLGFSWYVAHFGRFDRVYGSLGAVIGFMTWIWLSLTVVLFGAELNAEIEPNPSRSRAA